MVLRTPERRPEIVRVMIAAEDQSLIQDVQLHLIESFPIEFIGSASSGRECLRTASDLRPNVLLIAEEMTDIPALQLSKQVNLTLSGVATVILTKQDTTEYLHKALGAGARGVVSIPLARERLITNITQAHELERGRAQRRLGPSPERLTGRLIVIHSAKGGVGKSLLASNLAVVIAQARPASKVMLLDLNLQFGNLGVLLDIQPARSIYDLLPVIDDLNASVIDNVLYKKRFGERYELLVLPAPLEPRQADEFAGVHINSILAALKRYYDVIVVDTTSTISDITLAALQMADHVLLMCTPDVLSISQTRATLEYLNDLGVRRDAISLVLNRISRQAEIKPEDIKRLFDYSVIGEIPLDSSIQTYVNSGAVLAEVSRSLPIVQRVHHIANQLGLMPQKPKKETTKRRLSPRR